MTDTDLIDFLQARDGVGLISDDGGRWAVSDVGFQSVPETEPTDIVTAFNVAAHEWHPGVREAILAYREKLVAFIEGLGNE